MYITVTFVTSSVICMQFSQRLVA